jgi:hypothetical protein
MMRRLPVLLALAATAVLAGCTASLPAGVDGDLTNGWPAMAEPKVSVPVTGACYDLAANGVATGDEPTQSCTAQHAAETVYVGGFTGADAQRSSPPPFGGPARAAAYAQCRKGAVDYLGDDYLMGLLRLDLVLPAQASWDGGARWFRCDIVRLGEPGSDGTSIIPTSVKDGLRGARPLGLSCYTMTVHSDNSRDEVVTPCDRPHNAELVGLYTAPDIPWPTDEKAREDLAFKGCDAVVGKYLGFTGGHDNSPYVGYAISFFDQTQWELGERIVRCSAVGLKNGSPNNVRFTGSVKGLQARKPQGWS